MLRRHPLWQSIEELDGFVALLWWGCFHLSNLKKYRSPSHVSRLQEYRKYHLKIARVVEELSDGFGQDID